MAISGNDSLRERRVGFGGARSIVNAYLFIGFVLLLVAAILFVACTGQKAGASKQDVDRAKDIQMALFSGEKFKLSEMRGRPVVVNFWFPSCLPCRSEMPDLEKAWQHHKDKGLVLVGVQLVGLDSAEDGKEFLKEIGVTYPSGADENGSIVEEYQVSAFPTTFFITKDQRIARRWVGVIDAQRLEQFIQEIQ